MPLGHDINTQFEKANGLPEYLGTIQTGKSNFDATTPFYNVTSTLTLASVLATHTLVFTPVVSGEGRIVTLTAVAGAPANENQFTIDGATDADDAAALAAAINAHPVLSQWMVAASSGAVVTLAARVAAVLLNITQGVGATVTIARGLQFGRTLAGETLLLEASGDLRFGGGATAALAVTAANASTGKLLPDTTDRVVHMPPDRGYLASVTGTLLVFRLR